MKISVDRRFALAENVLRRVEIPGFDIDVVTASVVRRLSLRSGQLVVYVDYVGTLPSCFFCRFIGDVVWARLLSEMKHALEKEGFKDIVFVDFAARKPIDVS